MNLCLDFEIDEIEFNEDKKLVLNGNKENEIVAHDSEITLFVYKDNFFLYINESKNELYTVLKLNVCDDHQFEMCNKITLLILFLFI